MTAYKVIDNHKDLDGIGSFTHDQIDDHITGTPFVVLSGSASIASSRRILIAGQGVTITDSGPGGYLTISADKQEQTSTVPLMSWMEIPSGSVDGSNTVFSLNNQPFPHKSLQLYDNGVLQQGGGEDYLLSGNSFIMNDPPLSGSSLVATYQYRFEVPYGGLVSWLETPSGEVDGTNDTFVFQHVPDPRNSLMMYVNGVLQSLDNDFSLSANSVIFLYPPLSASKITATYAYSDIPVIGKNTSWLEIPSGLIDGENSIFSSVNEPVPQTAMMLFINGVLQRQGSLFDFTMSGSQITTSVPPLSGSSVVVNYPY